MIPDMEAWNFGYHRLVTMDRKKQKQAQSLKGHNRVLNSIWETANLLRSMENAQHVHRTIDKK